MDFEAVQGFASHHDPTVQTRALQYFEQLKASEDGWQLCARTLTSAQILDEHVIFFCIQVIEHFVKTRYIHSKEEEQQFLRHFIKHWLQFQSHAGVVHEVFIRNKIAQLVCLVFLADYPHRWPKFFDNVLELLTLGPPGVDYYLRILLAINSDVADREIARTQKELERNTLIKDTVRECSIMRLVDSWFHIVTTYQTSSPELSCLCLEVIGAYVAWIDISLIANNRFVSILVQYLSLPQLREAACECILEIINKGMEPSAKTKLVESFVTVLEQAGVLNPSQADEDADFVIKLAKLVSGIGTSLLVSWSKLSRMVMPDPEQLAITLKAVENKVPLLLQFLNNEDDDVSLGVCDFAREFIQFLKQQSSVGAYNASEKSNAEALLHIIINKYKYDDSYNFDHQGEDEASFDEYRKSLKVLFDNLAQLDNELVLSRMKTMITTTLQQWRNSPFQDVEAAITFLYLLGEAVPASHGNHFIGDGDKPTVMTELLRLLVTCGVSTYGHMAVTLHFFETVVRYEKFFSQEPHHIPEVLVAFMDERGLHNRSPRVRSRTCYLFSRFIKCLKVHIHRYTEDIVKRVQDLLVLAPPENGFNTALLTPDDQLFLYEASAVLIVSSQFETQHKKQLLLKNLLNPVMAKFEMFLQRLPMETDKEKCRAVAECMSHAIACTSRTSKAFSNQQTMKTTGVVQVYTDALKVFLQALELPQEQTVLQSAVRQFLHRMVVCLEEEVLPFIPLAAENLLKNADTRSIQEFIPLINQVIGKFKLSWVFQKEIVPFLQRIFMPLVTAIFKALAIPTVENDQQAQRERQVLQRSYFQFIAAIVTNNVTEVLASQDMQSMEQVLLTIIQGAVDFPDPVAQKTCFSILRKMVEFWGGPEGVAGFVEFMYKSIVPACFLAPLKDTFDLTDAQTILALTESALCLKAVYEKRGDEFISFLHTEYLPTMNVSPQQITDYCHALKSESKVFKNYLKIFIQHAKS
ncbi:exportin-T-like isoform X1 [Limulus polyphemus]|uniref:Exportin-T n=1 Tax=Limulus polyphemus TaxID=6850 RepID=A0ABM1S3S3_LIMPO|nr:exportin-T-like isoform X1 [Limulus polyphemus]XP_022238278.1 exportin-T-like isoform X1 [Limulus polyphemus]